MSTWYDVDRSLDASPVTGVASDFETVATQFRGFEESATSVVAGFVRLTDGDTTQFEGKAAAAFIQTLGEVADDMRDLPALAGTIAVIFRDHADLLRRLQAEVDRALAVALTTRAERDAESQAVGSSSAALTSVRAQLASLRAAGAEETDPQVTQLVDRERSQGQQLSSAQVRLSGRDEAMGAAVDQYERFRFRSDDINRSTADRLRSIDLRSMSDPSTWEKIGGWAGDAFDGLVDFLQEFAADIAAMVAAAASGDWNEFFWRLNDVLRTLVTVVGLVLMVASLLIPGAGILVAGAILALVLAGGVFATSVGLKVAGGVNSETGRRMDWGTVALDAAGVVLAVVGVGAARTAAANFKGVKFAQFPKGLFLRGPVKGPEGAITGAREAAFRAFKAESLVVSGVKLQKTGVGMAHNQQMQQSDGPFPSVRLAPPASCSTGTRAMIGAAA